MYKSYNCSLQKVIPHLVSLSWKLLRNLFESELLQWTKIAKLKVLLPEGNANDV